MALSSSVYLTTVAENFQIYSVQITRKCICQTFPSCRHDLSIGSSMQKNSPINLLIKVFPPMKTFFSKRITLCTLPYLKVFGCHVKSKTKSQDVMEHGYITQIVVRSVNKSLEDIPYFSF